MTTTMLTPERVNRLQDKANQALLDHDWPTLERLVAPGARILGPRGFLISRDRWIGVHKEAAYEQERIEVVESVAATRVRSVHELGRRGRPVSRCHD